MAGELCDVATSSPPGPAVSCFIAPAPPVRKRALSAQPALHREPCAARGPALQGRPGRVEDRDWHQGLVGRARLLLGLVTQPPTYQPLALPVSPRVTDPKPAQAHKGSERLNEGRGPAMRPGLPTDASAASQEQVRGRGQCALREPEPAPTHPVDVSKPRPSAPQAEWDLTGLRQTWEHHSSSASCRDASLVADFWCGQLAAPVPSF